jgi:hypothetical protein
MQPASGSNSNAFTVYRSPARYAAWPANYGMWAWGDEIVLCFTVGYPSTSGSEAGFHTRDKTRQFTTMQARSLDGGVSWDVVEAPLSGAASLSAHEHQTPEVLSRLPDLEFQSTDDLNFFATDFVVMCGRTDLTEGATSWFYTSTDRCKSWTGPHKLPMFGELGIAARTDWMIEGPRSATILLTSTNYDGQEGRVFAARTYNGGASFSRLGWIDVSPPGFQIMPASVKTSLGHIVTAVRTRGKTRRENSIDVYSSQDGAESWSYLGKAVTDTGNGGNPPTLNMLEDGRLVMFYGSRVEPFGIYMTTSPDLGKSWNEPEPIRLGGGGHDLGYPRAVVRSDGSLVVGYYFNESEDGERYIEASIVRA